MVRPISKWIMYRYSVLWRNFEGNEFNHNDALRVLDNDKMLSVALSMLKRDGWLEVKLDPRDARKRIYNLLHPEDAVKQMEWSDTD